MPVREDKHIDMDYIAVSEVRQHWCDDAYIRVKKFIEAEKDELINHDIEIYCKLNRMEIEWK